MTVTSNADVFTASGAATVQELHAAINGASPNYAFYASFLICTRG